MTDQPHQDGPEKAQALSPNANQQYADDGSHANHAPHRESSQKSPKQLSQESARKSSHDVPHDFLQDIEQFSQRTPTNDLHHFQRDRPQARCKTCNQYQDLTNVFRTLKRDYDSLNQLYFDLHSLRSPILAGATNTILQLNLFMRRLSNALEPLQIDPELNRLLENTKAGHLKALQEAGDKYSKLEDQIFNQIFRHTQNLDEVFQSYPDIPPASLTDSESSQHNSQLVPEGSVEDHVSPKAKYYSRIDQVGKINEDLYELRAEHDHLLATQNLRAKVGLSLDADSLELLEQFDEEERRLLTELANAERNLSEMRQYVSEIEGVYSHDEDNSPFVRQGFEGTQVADLETRSSVQPDQQTHTSAIDPSSPPTPTDAIPPENLVKTWILDQAQSSRSDLGSYTKNLENNPEFKQDEDESQLFQDLGLKERLAAQARIRADKESIYGRDSSRDDLIDSNQDLVEQKDDQVIITGAPLLKLNEDTTAAQLIDNATKFSRSRSPPAARKRAAPPTISKAEEPERSDKNNPEAITTPTT